MRFRSEEQPNQRLRWRWPGAGTLSPRRVSTTDTVMEELR